MDMPMGEDLYESFINYQRRVIQELDILATEFEFDTLDATRSVDENAEQLARRVSELLEATESLRGERSTA